jgi:uncharacterized RDD family membrane protein YckC
MSQISITTSQNVNIFFNTASIGERMLAFLIDICIKIVYLVFVYAIVFKYLDLYKFVSTLDNISQMAFFFLFTFPIYFDTLFWEIIWDGQTIGKKLVKIKVVKIDGYQAHIGDFFMRWVFRLVDIYTNSGAVGIVSMIVSNKGQRLGDIASGTTVISLKNKINISHTILEEIQDGYQPIFSQVIAFSDEDIRIIKENFQKAVAQKDNQILHTLAEKIRGILKIDEELQGLTERKFIETVVKDYNFYTGKNVA